MGFESGIDLGIEVGLEFIFEFGFKFGLGLRCGLAPEAGTKRSHIFLNKKCYFVVRNPNSTPNSGDQLTPDMTLG